MSYGILGRLENSSVELHQPPSRRPPGSHPTYAASQPLFSQDSLSVDRENCQISIMEEAYSVNSPRRILSFSKNRKATVSFPDPDEKASSFGRDHGPKPSEVYGFVGSITTVVATVIFMIWAYVPEYWLHTVGIFYYPSRYWALAVPAYIMVTIVLVLGFYIGLNFMSTPPPTSYNTIYDEFTRESMSKDPSTEGNEQPIEPISDIGIDQINRLMFDG